MLERLMKRLLIALSVLWFILATGGVAGAGLLNPGFETGDLTYWHDYGGAVVTTSTQTFDGITFTAPEGTHFAVLSAPTPVWLTDPDYGFLYLQNYRASIWQDVNLNAGETVKVYGFLNFNPSTLYANAFASVSVNYNPIWGIDNSQSYSSWQSWSFMAPSAGNYTFELSIFDDSNLEYGRSEAFFDINRVPLPGAVWLLGSGLLGLVGWGRFKKS
jgi:hypothetical protein